jgi:pimeloyl-CoA dehydrogenase small subunit
MDFDLSEEQAMLKDAVERLMADRYGFEDRKRHMAEPQGWSASMWEAYGEMGLLALPFAEADGGLGGGPVETMIVMEALGGSLALEPYLSTVVLCGSIVRFGGNDDQRAALVPAIGEGALKLALAHSERGARYDLAHVETTARAEGDGYVLDGAKVLALHGDSADRLFVTARLSGQSRDETGVGVFLVDADAPGVTRRSYRTQDGARAADIRLDGVKVGADALFGTAETGVALIRRASDAAIAALCAEAVGAMSAMHRLTVEYLKVRKQFGLPIGAFQVLQHQAVDQFVAIEQAKSITLYATMMADSDDAGERARAMHAAKAEIGRQGRLVGESAIQLHGGVGMTMEYAVGHYFKRMTMIDITFGDSDHHLRALAAMGGLFEAA